MIDWIKRSLLSFACLCCCAFGLNLAAQDSGSKVIQPQGYATADSFYSPGILAGGTLYISGQGSRKPDGTRPPVFAEQVAQALSNVQAVLKGASMNFGNVVWMNVYLTDEQDVTGMNEIYWQRIGQSPPRGLFSRLPRFRMGKGWKSTALPWQTQFTEKPFGQQAGREAPTWIRLQSGQVKSCTCRHREVGIRSPAHGRLTSPEKSGRLSIM